MTSLRQLGKKAKEEAGKTVNQVLDANLEEAYETTKPKFKSVLGFICTALLLLTGTLCVMLWISEIERVFSGEFGGIASKSPYERDDRLFHLAWFLFLAPALTSRILRIFLGLNRSLPKITKFCEYLTYSTAIIIILDYITFIYSYAFIALAALIHATN